MIQDVKSFVSIYSALNIPIQYKELYIYPVSMRDYYNFMTTYDILCVEKNKIPDAKIIQMSYLDFMIEILFNNQEPIPTIPGYTIGMMNEEKLLTLLGISMEVNQNEVGYYKKENHYYLLIKNVEINAKEFDEIRRIILYENIIEYNEEYVDPEVKQAVIDFYDAKNKGILKPTLEDKMASISAVNGLTKKDFIEMSIREFDMLFEKCKSLVDYQVQKSAELSGNVKFDEPVEHWIYHKPYDPYKRVFSSYDDFKKEISNS